MLEQKYKHVALSKKKNSYWQNIEILNFRLTFALFTLYSINDVPVFCENCPNDICQRRRRGKRAALTVATLY